MTEVINRPLNAQVLDRLLSLPEEDMSQLSSELLAVMATREQALRRKKDNKDLDEAMDDAFAEAPLEEGVISAQDAARIKIIQEELALLEQEIKQKRTAGIASGAMIDDAKVLEGELGTLRERNVTTLQPQNNSLLKYISRNLTRLAQKMTAPDNKPLEVLRSRERAAWTRERQANGKSTNSVLGTIHDMGKMRLKPDQLVASINVSRNIPPQQ